MERSYMNKNKIDYSLENLEKAFSRLKEAFEESKVIQNKIEKDNPEKVKEKKSSCSCC